MAQDSVKQGGVVTKGKPAVERVWLHPKRLPGMNRQGGATKSPGAGDENHQHQGSASLHLPQPPKLRCESYQTSPTAGHPSSKVQSYEIQPLLDLVALHIRCCSSLLLWPWAVRGFQSRKKQAPYH